MALKFKTSGSSDDALAQLLQLSQHYQGVKQRKKDDINSSLKSILDLSRYATNENSLANITNQWKSQKSKASEYEETNVYYDLIGNVLQDRGAQIGQYSTVVDQAQGIVNDANFLRQGSDFENLPEWVKGQVDDEGKPKYDSVMQWVSDEYARIETISNTLESGSKLGFRRGKGIDDTNIQTQMNQYKNRLNTTLEALIGDEAITAEEAQLIIAGDRDTFKQVRNTNIDNITRGIEEYDEMIQKFDNETVIDDLLEGMEGIPDNFIYSESDTSEREAVLKTLITERDKRIDNYKKWSGTDYAAAYTTVGELEKQDFEGAMGQEFDEVSGEFTGEKDKQDIELEKFQELSPEKQKTYIEEKKKIGKEQYEESMKPENKYMYELKTETPPKISGRRKNINVFKSNELFRRAQNFKVHPSLQKKVNETEPKGFGSTFGDRWMFHAEIMDESNRLKEKDKILDGTDKAAPAMNKYLLGELNQGQALTAGAWGESKGMIVGKKSRKKINSFKLKFKNSNLTIEEFIAQNKEEYYEMTKILKYGDYWFKNPKRIGKSKHYINLYD